MNDATGHIWIMGYGDQGHLGLVCTYCGEHWVEGRDFPPACIFMGGVDRDYGVVREET